MVGPRSRRSERVTARWSGLTTTPVYRAGTTQLAQPPPDRGSVTVSEVADCWYGFRDRKVLSA